MRQEKTLYGASRHGTNRRAIASGNTLLLAARKRELQCATKLESRRSANRTLTLERLAASNLLVLIHGENRSGKEVIAKLVHSVLYGNEGCSSKWVVHPFLELLLESDWFEAL